MILRLDQVSKSYMRGGQSRLALDSVSLELHPGELIGVFGISGSGKTTLIRVAAGLETPDSGFVSYKGERLDRMSAKQQRRYRRREVGCVWGAQPWEHGLSVLEYVALPLLIDGCDYRTAERTARKFLLACEAEQCLGSDPQRLSDGERQRVEIARALVIEPRMILMDGALSHLALMEQEGIMLLLKSMAREARVAVLVTDSGAGAMLGADSIRYLSDGKLAGEDAAASMGEVVWLPGVSPRQPAADA
jgi:putative ABC transport system ATP-binding protein